MSKEIIEGAFRLEGDELSFHCHTENASFERVYLALTKLQEEIKRQMDNRDKCPYYSGK
jgi:hypothetical protein